MSRVIPFRRRSSVPSFLLIALGTIAVAMFGFENFIGPAVPYIGVDQTRVEILQPTPDQFDQRPTPNQFDHRPASNQSGQRLRPNQFGQRPTPNQSGPIQSGQIDVIDGDTVRLNGTAYRLAGIDTPERGNRARSDDERRRADAATNRLRALVAGGNAQLTRVPCACPPGLEGTRDCNYGRRCGSLSIGGQDAGNILMSEGHARPYKCSASGCPRRRPW